MNILDLWLVLLAGGLLTYATRLSFILIMGRMEVPVWLRRSLRFVPPAVLSAIIFPELFLHTGSLDLSSNNHRLLAGILAILVAYRTRNILLTIIAGMMALLFMQVLLR